MFGKTESSYIEQLKNSYNVCTKVETAQEVLFEEKYQKLHEDAFSQGYQGSVYRVVRRDDPKGKVYAAKIYHVGSDYDQKTYETEVMVYSMIPQDTPLIGKLHEHFDEGNRKVLILELIEGRQFKKHEEDMPTLQCQKIQVALKQAIQMTMMLLILEKSDIFYGDFHGENIMVKKNGDLILTDFGYSAKICNYAGKLDPKGHASESLHFDENEDPSQFKTRRLNEHYGRELLHNLRKIQKTVIDDENNEYFQAFKFLIKYLNESLDNLNESYDEDKKDEQSDDKKDKKKNKSGTDKTYKQYRKHFSQSKPVRTFSEQFQAGCQMNGPSLCQYVMDKLRYIVLDDEDLLRMTFYDANAYQNYKNSIAVLKMDLFNIGSQNKTG